MTFCSARQVLSVCCVSPRVQLMLCDKFELPEESVVGLSMLLAAAEGEIVPESAEVQKAALQVRQKYLIDTKNIWSTSLGAVLPRVRAHPAARQRQDRGHPHPQVQAGQGRGPEQRGGHQQGGDTRFISSHRGLSLAL